MEDLTGKRALVTGAGKRVGRAIALALAEAGADILIHYNTSARESDAVAAEVLSLGRKADTIRGDLSDPAQIDLMLSELDRHDIAVDILVNSAAVYYPQRLGEITGGCYTGIGNEATSVGASAALDPDDVIVPTHRDMGMHVVRGHDALAILRQYLKRGTSQTEGKDSGLHLGLEGSNIVGMISHLAHMAPVAVGVALTCLNFLFLRKLIFKWTREAATGDGSNAPLLVLPKMIGMMVAVVLCLALLPIDGVAFTIGYSIFVVSIVVELVMAVFRPAAAPSEESRGG